MQIDFLDWLYGIYTARRSTWQMPAASRILSTRGIAKHAGSVYEVLRTLKQAGATPDEMTDAAALWVCYSRHIKRHATK